MRNHIILRALLIASLSLTAGGAQAQLTEDVLDYVGELAGAPPRNGHDKCQGQGHQDGKGGGGHEEGECQEEGEDAPGPVATEACYAVDQAPESAWQRYSCTLVTYNEDYAASTVEANESYPQALSAYATDEVVALQSNTTKYATLAIAELVAGDIAGVAEAGNGLLAGVTRYVPLAPLPGPGPVIDETRAFATNMVTYITAGDVDSTIAESQGFVAGVTRYVPLAPLPGPGPVIGDYRLPTMPSGF
jgi:hypothetical protein